MTGNAQFDHRKYFNFFTLNTAGGQLESLQADSILKESIVSFAPDHESQHSYYGFLC